MAASRTWLRLAIALLLVLGLCFRFLNLDRKVYWHDEVYTSLRISGYTRSELVEQLFKGQVTTSVALQQYQRPNAEKTLHDAVKALAIEDSQHPPLYYVLVRAWAQQFGNSVTAIRSLSALLSLLVFPCLYWLCLELFESYLAAWVAIALTAVSPFQILLAQEAREFSLWSVTILLCSSALLRAIRQQTIVSWGMYAIALALAFYTFLFSGLVALGHGIYVAAIALGRQNKTLICYLLSSLVALLLFAPWIWAVVAYLFIIQISTGWTAVSLPWLTTVKLWALNFSRVFLDVNSGFDEPITYLLSLPILVLIGYSIYFLSRYAPLRISGFILTLTGTTFLVLLLPDLIAGGQRSTVARYLVPCYLGLELSVTYLFTSQITTLRANSQKLWQLLLAGVITSGIISGVVMTQANTWWSKVVSTGHPQIAQLINQSASQNTRDRPLLIADSFGINPGNVISLSYWLDPAVKLLLIPEQTIPKIPEEFSPVFWLNPAEDARSQLSQQSGLQMQPIYQDNHLSLWRLVP